MLFARLHIIDAFHATGVSSFVVAHISIVCAVLIVFLCVLCLITVHRSQCSFVQFVVTFSPRHEVGACCSAEVVLGRLGTLLVPLGLPWQLITAVSGAQSRKSELPL